MGNYHLKNIFSALEVLSENRNISNKLCITSIDKTTYQIMLERAGNK